MKSSKSRQKTTQKGLPTEHLRLWIELIPDAMVIVNQEGRIVLVNAQTEKLFGYQRKELLGQPVETLIPKRYRDMHTDYRRGYVQHPRARPMGESLELCGLRKDGSEFAVEISLGSLKTGEGILVAAAIRDVTEHKRAEEALHADRERLELLLSRSPAVTYSCELSGDYRCTYISANITAQLGYEAREFTEDPRFWIDRIHPEDAPRVLAELPRLFETGYHIHEYRFRHKDGSYRWMRDELKLVRDAAGNPMEAIGFWIDVTEHKQAEVRINLLARALEASTDLISITDVEGRFQFANPAFLRTFGYTEEELLGKHYNLVRSPSIPPALVLEAEEGIRHGGWQGELLNRRKDGSEFPVWLTAAHVKDKDGRVVGYLGSARDITERRQAEETLHQSEQKFRQLVQTVNEIVYMVEGTEETPAGGPVQLVSDQVENILGYQPTEFLEDPNLWFRSLHPDDVPSVLESTEKMFRTKQACTRVYRLRHKNTGEYRWMEDRVVPQLDTSGKVIGIFGAARDFTDRKQAEEALRASEEKFAKAFRSNPAVISISTLEEERFVEVNDTFIRRTGYRREEIIGRTAEELNLWVNPADRERVLVALRKDQKLSNLELYFRTRSGEIHTGLCSAEMIHLAGQPCLLTVVEDITERKQAEEERERLRAEAQAAEQRFRELVQGLDAIVWEADPTTWRFSFVSQRAEAILGYPVEQWLSEPNFWSNHIHPEDRERAVAICRAATSEGKDHDFEYRALAADGRVVWLHDIIRVVFDAEVGPRKLCGLMVDVSERKRAEQKLRLYEQIFADTNEAIAILDPQGHILQQNAAHRALLGFPDEELRGKSPAVILSEETFSQIVEELSHKGAYRGEVLCRNRAGAKLDIALSVVTVRDQRGEVSCHVIQKRDITERKRAEEALRESEEKYRSIFEAFQDVFYRAEREGGITVISPSVLPQAGYDPKEVIGRPVTDFYVNPSDHEVVETRLRESGVVNDYELKLKTKTRGAVDVSVSCHLVYGKDGQPVAVEGVLRDITERKRAEEALRTSEERFSKVFRASPAAISISTLHDGRFLDVNDSFLHLTGYESQEVIGHTALELNLWPNPEDRARLVERLLEQGTVRNAELNFLTRSGGLLVTLLSAELVTIGGEQCILAVVQDITDRKRTEDMLRGLSGRLLHVQDEERRRIARELHDQFAQTTAAAAMNLTRLAGLAVTLDERCRRLLSETCEMVERCVVDVRTFSYLLHPPLLDELGLLPALRTYVDGFRERSGIQLELDLPDELRRLPRDVELTLFRIAQECLTNIHLHSGSTTARIGLALDSAQVVLEVRDEGHGMPPGTMDGGGHSNSTLGVGITGMRERVRQLGGRLEIHSSSQGTTVRAELPLREGKK